MPIRLYLYIVWFVWLKVQKPKLFNLQSYKTKTKRSWNQQRFCNFCIINFLKEAFCRSSEKYMKCWKTLKKKKNPSGSLKYIKKKQSDVCENEWWMFETKTRWKSENRKSHPLCNSLLYPVPLPVEAPLVLALYIFTQTNLLKGLMSTEE